MTQGRIIKSIAGTYTVLTEEGAVICRPRGKLRLKGISPITGDIVEITKELDNSGAIEKILPRRNMLERPTIANVDQVIVVIAPKPKPNFLLVDKILIAAEHLNLNCVVVVNKIDLTKDAKHYLNNYLKTGYSLHAVSTHLNKGLTELATVCQGHISVLAGQSGVGKSSILNLLCPKANLSTQAISDKRGFGRHTTRTVSLMELPGGGLIADTPGFSKLDMKNIASEKLAAHFPEMIPYLGKCRYKTCVHHSEPDCAVVSAVSDNHIHEERYQNYLTALLEIRENEKRKYQ